jgi:glutaconate CoA-transferase, subunit A
MSTSTKIMSAKEAIKNYVSDGTLLHFGGFGHLYPYALAHEVIRQRKRDLTIFKHSPEALGDQLIGAGCVKKFMFGWIGNPQVGPAYCFDRALKQGIPNRIEFEEYSHHGLATRLRAGAYGVPFLPTMTMYGSEYPKINPNVKTVVCPFTGRELVALQAINPDVTLLHVQRCDEFGNAQAWGVLGDIREAAFASRRVLISAEEIVPTEVIRRDPNRTIVPGFRVDAVVEEPWGAHPSYAQGYYDRDNQYFVEYGRATRTEEGFSQWLKEWVDGVSDRAEYIRKLGPERISRLKPQDYFSDPVNYGWYGM